jgi:hypothetical protein
MRVVFILVFVVGAFVEGFTQLSTSVMNGTSLREMSTNKLIERYLTLGVMVKKPVGLSWNFGTGLGYKSVETRVVDYINDSDFAPYFRAKYPSKTLSLNAYFNDVTLYAFHFVYFPCGAEFAVLPGFRLRYTYHVNLLLKGNSNVSDYLEHGTQSANRLSGNHDFALLFLNPVVQGHLIVGVVTQPQLANKNQTYNYDFTPAFYNKFGGALSFYVGINYEVNAKPRKRNIL